VCGSLTAELRGNEVALVGVRVPALATSLLTTGAMPAVMLVGQFAYWTCERPGRLQVWWLSWLTPSVAGETDLHRLANTVITHPKVSNHATWRERSPPSITSAGSLTVRPP
jgi:hypothetical protein